MSYLNLNIKKLMSKKAWLFVFVFSLLSNVAYSQLAWGTNTSSADGLTMTLNWTADGQPNSYTLIVYTLDGDFTGWSGPTGPYSGTTENTEVDAPSGVYFVYWGNATTYGHTSTANTTYYYRAYSSKSNEQYSGTSVSSTDLSLPVELSLWEAKSDNSQVNLIWITESEIENQGFILDRRLKGESDFTEIASFITHPALLGQGSTTRQTIYDFTDEDVEIGETYEYRLADVDYVSTITYHDVIRVTVRADEDTQLPGSMSLQNAYPNPFNPVVNLGFTLEAAADVVMCIYDLQGRLVKTMAQGAYPAGTYNYQWDGLNTQGEPQNSGVYLVQLNSGTESQIQRITLLR